MSENRPDIINLKPVRGWRWCPVAQEVEEWFEDAGCSWCEGDEPHDRLVRVAS